MTPDDLFDRLIEQGCNPNQFRIGARGGASDVLCLRRRDDGAWLVLYSERGLDSPPEFHSFDEMEAVRYFETRILGLEHWHCVGLFGDKHTSGRLHARLESAGMTIRSDSIPYGGPEDRRFRVFVKGTGIFAAREMLGSELPLLNYDEGKQDARLREAGGQECDSV